MMKPIRLRADTEVVKSLPRGVNRARDEDDIVGTGRGERRIDRLADGGNGDRVRVRTERGRDLFRVVRPLGFRSGTNRVTAFRVPGIRTIRGPGRAGLEGRPRFAPRGRPVRGP